MKILGTEQTGYYKHPCVLCFSEGNFHYWAKGYYLSDALEESDERIGSLRTELSLWARAMAMASNHPDPRGDQYEFIYRKDYPPSYAHEVKGTAATLSVKLMYKIE